MAVTGCAMETKGDQVSGEHLQQENSMKSDREKEVRKEGMRQRSSEIKPLENEEHDDVCIGGKQREM